jgi:Secretion system C-terminal sorting domain
MKSKTTRKVSVMGISILFLSFLFIGSNNLFAQNGSDCDNETIISGNVEKVISNNGVQQAWKIKGTANAHGARFFDNPDRLIVKLDDEVTAGQQITVTWKMRNYNSSYSGPSKLKVYESKDGNSFTYNSTLTTEVKNHYIEKIFTVDDDTRYLKLVNGSSYYHGSPDFLVDALSFSYRICNDHCPNGPEPGTPCDDGNANTTNDVINDNCDCEGTTPPATSFTVCSKIDNSRDDAEEDLSGNVDTGSGDLELIYDNADGDQIVGMKFNSLNIPQGAVITNAFIQFTADASIGIDPCNLNIYGEASDNAAAFSTDNGNVSSRPKTDASVLWSPEAWTTGDAGAAQQTDDIASVIQEIVDRSGFGESSSIAIIIEGVGKRTAVSYDGDATQAAILCITFQSGGCHDSDNDGVCDEDDLCEGFDDNIDIDGDGIPDGCDDCLNEENVSGNAKKVVWNWGVKKAWRIRGVADNKGARFFDNHDKLAVKLGDEVAAGQQITVTWKMRNYNSSYSGPSKLEVYTSNNGYSYTYNSTLVTDVKNHYIEKIFTVDDDTRYLKLVNGSSYYHGSPDFLVDALSYTYRICDEVQLCPNGPEPGTPCDDGNNLTINDAINANCECEGTPLANYNVCSKIDSSSDDAEEDLSGNMDVSSGDLELIYDNSDGDQVVGLRFNNLNIPQGAIITNAYINFTVDVTTDIDPCNLTIAGEASDNAVTFTTDSGNISGRTQTNAFASWSPADWTTVGAVEQTIDISAVIQEIVDRGGYTSGSSIALIIEGVGKRTAVSFNGNATQAPELCIAYSAPLQGGTPQGMVSNNSSEVEAAGERLGLSSDTDPEFRGESNSDVKDSSEKAMLAPTSINIFPNPASRALNINLANHIGKRARISVYNQLGQLQDFITIETVTTSPVKLNVANYQNGVYYMTVKFENSKMITRKFMVNRMY